MAHQIHGKLSSSSSSLQEQHCWTDDLPICPLSGVGYATNAFYRDDGLRREEHEYQDKCFHYKSDEGIYLYGIFHGHDGSKVANIAAQHFPADLLLGQLGGKKQDSEIIDLIRQAFLSVDREFFSSIDDLLAEKARLRFSVSESTSPYRASTEQSTVYDRLQAIDNELAGGATGVIALVVNNKLFVASVGCCSAVLCKQNDQGDYQCQPLSVNHDLSNPQELQRLIKLGLDVEKLRQIGKIGRFNYTRTLGDYYVKGGYKDIQIIRNASREPVICEPHITVTEVDHRCSFLLLISEGLLQAVNNSLCTPDSSTDIVRIILNELSLQGTLNGAAQAVVDSIVRKHHETFMTSNDYRKALCQKRDDVTLLIRNFTFPMTRIGSSSALPFLSSRTAAERRSLDSIMRPLNLDIPSSKSSEHIQELGNDVLLKEQPACFRDIASVEQSDDTINEESYSSISSLRKKELPLDESGCIRPYVDFTEFYDYLNSLSESERKEFEAEVELKSTYDTIPEEHEPNSNQSTPHSMAPTQREGVYV